MSATGNIPNTRMTLEEFRRANPDFAWVGMRDRAGICQFGGLGTMIEYLILPKGGDFRSADFTGTSPKGISAVNCDLRGAMFDSTHNDFTDFDATGARLGGAYLPGADIRGMKVTSRTSFYDLEFGGAYLVGSNAERQHFEGVDLRKVEAQHSKWSHISVDKATRLIGLNLSYSEVYAS